MLRLHRQRTGNEAKSAFGKAWARTPLIIKLGVMMSLTTAFILLNLLYMTSPKSKQIVAIVNPSEMEQREAQQVQDRAGQKPDAPEIPAKKKKSRARRPNKEPNAKEVQKEVAKVANDNEVKAVAPPDAPNVKPKDKLAKLKKRQYQRLLTSDQHTYTGADIPYFNEDVPSFRRRVSRLISSGKKGSIFVSLGSFRDDLCPATLLELFEKAKHPENVIVGLVDQVKIAEDSDDVVCDSSLPAKYRRQVRLVRLTSLEGRGPTHARYIASKLYEGENYYMQIDSHSHFKEHWDVKVRQQLNRLPNPSKNVITHYPPGDIAELNDSNPPWICSNRQHPDAPPGLLVQESDWCYPENRSPGVAVAPDGSLTTCVSPFMGGGFIVGPGSWIVDVPYDKYIPYIFHGEELLIASRLWTSGWDMFTPSENLLDHKYGGRAKNVYAETDTWAEIGELSTARARHILGTTLPGDDQIPFDKSELEYLGMGTERSYEDYLEFAGINLKGNSTGRCGQRYNWDTKQWEGEIKLMTG